MGLTLRRPGITDTEEPLRRGNEADADRLFDADWDELVIRFDEKRGKYNVETATELREKKTSELKRDDETEQKAFSVPS